MGFGLQAFFLAAFLSNFLAEKQNSRHALLCQNCKDITESKFSTDTKLCGAVSVLEGRDAPQWDQNTLGRWDHANKVKCKVLILPGTNTGWVENQSGAALLRRVLGVGG